MVMANVVGPAVIAVMGCLEVGWIEKNTKVSQAQVCTHFISPFVILELIF